MPNGQPAQLANLHPPWSPGKSGNELRQHKAYHRLIKHARITSMEMLETMIACARDKEAPWPARISAAAAVLERAWGKPKETVQLNGDGIATLRIQFVDERSDGPTIDGEAFQLSLKPPKESETEP